MFANLIGVSKGIWESDAGWRNRVRLIRRKRRVVMTESSFLMKGIRKVD